jgi:sodium/bile acid cotransporter 7
MLPFLLRRWFLFLLAGGLALAVLRPEWLLPLAAVLPLRLIVAASLFLMAWNLEGRRLWQALGRLGCLLWALAISFVCLPGLAVLAGPLLPADDLRVGLLIIVCVPCTLSSAVLWTRHGGGDEALALLIVVMTNGLGWLVTPLWLAGVGTESVTIDALAMMRSLVAVLVVPVAVGQGVRFVPGVARFAVRHRQLNGVVARLLVVLVLVCAAAEGASQADRLSWSLVLGTASACLGVHLSGVSLGLLGGKVLGMARPERIAVAIAGSQKTLPVGLFLFNAYYRADYPLAVLPMLLYHAGQLLADTIVADTLAAGGTFSSHEDTRRSLDLAE